MLLAIDVGNTQTVLGLFSGDEIDHSWRIVTPREQTTDEIAALFYKLFELYGLKFKDVTSVAISSVVPQLDHELIVLSRRFLEVDPLIIGPGVKTDLEIAYDNPQEVGADRIVNSVAAIRLYGCNRDEKQSPDPGRPDPVSGPE
ncbi:type III pantothenate kinase [Candidatus Hakubella thermalkaliphila]|nr:type III pantothenate kinase [Candidatus Hakubella thermalkaliphila]